MRVVQKIGIYLSALILAALVAGMYGILHDQISYTLSNEYFTRFKFIQFEIPWAYESPRLGVAYVGVLATWWMGILVFIPLGLFGFLFKSPKLMAIKLAKSFAVVIAVALLAGLMGLLYGYFQINDQTISANMQWVRPGVVDPVQFARVGYMHNASYLGGLTGLIAGICYLIAAKQRYNKPFKADAKTATRF